MLCSPKLSLYAREIQSYLDEEARRREAYYDWLTPDIKAEFINGEIIVQSPAKKRHTDVVANLATLLRTYVDEHDLGFLGAETVLITLTRNDYLPDIAYFTAGRARELSPDQMKFPPPDFIVEVLSPSTEEKDRELKFEDYAAHGVREYWLVDPEQQTVEQYFLRGEVYQLLLKVKAGPLSSEVISGFTIPVEAVFDAKVKNQVLGQILASN